MLFVPYPCTVTVAISKIVRLFQFVSVCLIYFRITGAAIIRRENEKQLVKPCFIPFSRLIEIYALFWLVI